ncbi:MAG: hypothetical protein MK199_10740, partial [Acidimicrobiales bacterium]|nr:hypothetical protein [Acidimicrobiales bacterium]
VDTGEEFTCRLRGDAAEFDEGIDESGVDFVVEIQAFQVERLASHIRTGELDEVEQFRVLTNVFGPVANSGFNNPAVGMFMTGRFFSWFIKRRNITHMHLRSPDPGQEPDVEYSLLFVNRQWLLVPGLHGTPERIFEIDIERGLALHRELVAATRAADWRRWMAFAGWYKRWRDEVEVT